MPANSTFNFLRPYMSKVKNFFKDVGSSATQTTKNFFNPKKLSDALSNTPGDIWGPVQEMKNFKPFTNNIMTSAGQLGNLGLGTVLPSTMVYSALAPGGIENDTAGTFENIGGRISSLIGASLMANNRMHHGKSIIGDNIGEMLGWAGSGAAMHYGGKALDVLSGGSVPKNVMMSRFMKRLDEFSKRIRAQYPEAPPEAIQQEAVNQILSQAKGYMQLFKQ